MRFARLGRACLALIVGVSLCACARSPTIEPTHALPGTSPSPHRELATATVPSSSPPAAPSQTSRSPEIPTVAENATLKTSRAPAPEGVIETSPAMAFTETPTQAMKEPTMKHTATPLLEPQGAPLTITLVYDNNPFDLRLQTDWGFSALVEYRGRTLLFDTGGNGNILLENMRLLGIDPTRIQSIVLSHAHGDHTGGLSALLRQQGDTPVYTPPSFAESYQRQLGQGSQVVAVTPGQEFAPDILTTGEIGGSIPEQALILRTTQGLVVITGCAHPGIVRIVERAIELIGERVYLVLGGFHLGSKSEAEISAILADFRRLGVQKVAPCHCTGALAMAMFAAEYGKDYLRVGVGSVITFDETGGIHVQTYFSSSRWI